MADGGPDNPEHRGPKKSSAIKPSDDRGTPEFVQEALIHLQIQSQSILVHTESYAEHPTPQTRKVLVEDLQRFRNTLVLLEKPAAVYVVTELLALLQADIHGTRTHQAEVARVLTSASKQLRAHVDVLSQDAGRDSAMPLLLLINDSRACREEALLSDSVVLAAGIDMPATKSADEQPMRWRAQRRHWIKFASARHARIARGLLYWWQAGEPGALQPLIRELARFAKTASKHEYLKPLQPLFQAALTVGAAIDNASLTDGPAVRSLFAQLERSVHRSALAKSPEDLVPQDLLRNFLYYVAQTTIDTPVASTLRRRFRLDRISAVAQAGVPSNTPTIGIGYQLATAIRSGIVHLAEPLQEWLDSDHQLSATSPDHLQIVRLRVRLGQLEPILALMGAPDALACLQQLNVLLGSIKHREMMPTAQRVQLRQFLWNLDALLDQSARESVKAAASHVAQAQAKENEERVFLEMATDACLGEARKQLAAIAQALDSSSLSIALRTGVASTAAQDMLQVARSMHVLPLPEASSLLVGLSQLLLQSSAQHTKQKHLTPLTENKTSANQPTTKELGKNNPVTGQPIISQSSADQTSPGLPSKNQPRVGSRQDVSVTNSGYLMVQQVDAAKTDVLASLEALDSYLVCVLLPQSDTGQWLRDAEKSLADANIKLGLRKPANDPLVEPVVESIVEHGTSAGILDEARQLADDLALAIEHYGVKSDHAAIDSVNKLLSSLALSESRMSPQRDTATNQAGTTRPTQRLTDDMAKLGVAAQAYLRRTQQHRPGHLSEQTLRVLDSVQAIIPRLFDEQGAVHEVPNARIEGVVELVQWIDSLSGVDISDNPTVSSAIAEDLMLGDDEALALTEDVGNLTLNLDDDLLIDSLEEAPEAVPDSALRQVFFNEAASYIDQLDSAVRAALQPRLDASQRLPNEPILRALHTLTGSAQTVEAVEIVNIVQPLQRAALARQRLRTSFDAAETRFMGDIVMALRARLEAMQSGGQVGRSVEAVERKLKNYFSLGMSGVENTDNSLFIAERVHSLDDVFWEEAREILHRMRAITHTGEPHNQASSDSALALLHTLKGSARMAGKSAMAQIAHDLEAKVQQAHTNVSVQFSLLKSGYQHLQSQLLDAQALQSIDDSADDLSTAHPPKDTTSLSPPDDSHDGIGARPSASDDVAKKVTQATAAIMGDKPVKTSLPAEASSNPAVSLSRTEGLQVTDAGFENLMDLATDVIVSQARLSDQLASLREVYQDIESAGARWHRLAHDTQAAGSAAFHETMADLEAARAVMRNALRQAEREQQQASRSSAGLQQRLIRTRLIRIDELNDRLSAAVEDAAQRTGCAAQLRFERGEVTVDRNLFKQLAAPLEHLVRNAMVHGIEPPETRLALGKPSQGLVLVSASIDGTDLVIQFSDDGAGIDRDVINAQLLAQGMAQVDTQEALRDVLFSSGFSTAGSTDVLAGRGLGLSAVRASIERLGGIVQLHTQQGEGTRINLRIPQRIVVKQVLLLQSQYQLFAIPVDHVEGVKLASLKSAAEDQHKQLFRLSELLGQKPDNSLADVTQPRPIVLVSTGFEPLAIEVDQVVGYREVIIQALGPQMASLGLFTGGGVMPDGKQVLVLNVANVLKSISPDADIPFGRTREVVRPVALVVDDSLTMRAAVQSILQQVGIATRISRDGVEALESMQLALPNVVLLDLEMPRLDGVGVLHRMRDMFGKNCPPVIIISSRDDSANRDLLLSHGAIRILTKPYTETQLLEALEAAGLRLPDLTIA